ncbi:MAG: YihA family ribosome biogenesis GTP-binding protein [Proteobacteria bacterium]|nr:YihA family ribosome biogenesis GTP-binding protein [Pseudomonadota bacterium]MCH8220466.1 YihA family ribosome biogenesis GTP-binding protein [Pseudomonadota bacterium]
MSSFNQAEFVISANRPAQFPPDKGSEVAFAGRSNVGKSSALNAIAGRKNLARTSKTPGRTQLVNFFVLPDGDRLVDLPGYGYARVPEAVRRHWRHLMEAYFNQRRSLAGLILVMDARRPLTEFDRQMLAWSEGVGCLTHILLTKADKLSRGKASAMLQEVRAAVDTETSVQLFSATRKSGVEQAREALTALLNRQPAEPASRVRGPG